MAEYRENQDVRRPFPAAPDARVYFPASTIENARKTIGRCLRRGEGVALALGDIGVGKTLLARVLASELEGDDLVAVVSATRKLDVRSFFQQLLYAFHQTFCGCDETELRLMTLDYIERAPQRRCALLIDDAQNLTLRAFDELRALIDRSAAVSKQTTVALFGGVALEERLNIPRLYPFCQRIVSRSYLEPFSKKETIDFIASELKRAQVGATFSVGAKEAVVRLSDGVPRVVDQLCDRALFFALDALASSKRTESLEVDEGYVERAWRDLQNLPEPSPSASSEASSSVVEFGLLDDEEEDEYNTENSEGENAASVDEDGSDERAQDDVESTASLEDALEEDERAEDLDESLETETSANDDESAENEETSEIEDVEELNEEEESAVEARSSEELDAENDENGAEVEQETERSEVSDEEEAALELEGSAEMDESEDDGTNDASEDENDATAAALSSAFESAFGSIEQAARPYFASDDERRRRAKNEFWNVDEDAAAERSENEREEDFDADLDARLREKFGFQELSDEDEEYEEPDEVVEKDGVRFELYNDAQSEPIEVEANDDLFSDDESDAEDEQESEYDEALDLSGDRNASYDERLPRSTTRRPITEESGDGSREYYEANGFYAEDFAKLATTDRDGFELLVSEEADAEGGAKLDALDPNARALDDRLYRQIASSMDRSVEDLKSSDRYLDELRLLEQEITEEANLIRRIRSIHLRLREAQASRPHDGLDGGDRSVVLASD